MKKLICTYGDQESDEDDAYEDSETKNKLYEDEYDDTYDSLLVGVKEPSLENEPEKDEPIDEVFVLGLYDLNLLILSIPKSSYLRQFCD